MIDTICQKMPQLESLDLSGLEMTGKWLWFHVAPMLHSDVITISALPKEIGNLQVLEKLVLGGCRKLEGKSRNPLSVAPMLHI